jgi:hypothetical protein
MTTRPSFRAEFKAGEGGKAAVAMARWVNTRGEKGPWSEVTTATVAARWATVAALPPCSTYSELRRERVALRGRRGIVLAPDGTEGFLGSGVALARARSVR